MATFAEVWAQAKVAIDVLDTLRTHLSGTQLSKLQSFGPLAGDNDRKNQAGERLTIGWRDAASRLVLEQRRLLEPLLEDLKPIIDYHATGLGDGFWEALRDYMDANAEAVQSRQLTIGSPSKVSGTGDGVIYRLSVDARNDTLEAVSLDTVELECVRDANSGARVGREEFEIRHLNPPGDAFAEGGSGRTARLVGAAGDQVLRNASFQTPGGAANAPTSIPNWESDITVSGTNYEFETGAGNWFRESPEERANGTAYSLWCKAAATLTQRLRKLGRALRADVPYLFGVRWARDLHGATSGTVSVSLGSTTASDTVGAQTGWQTLVPTVGSGLWLRNFNQDDLAFQLSVPANVNVDDAFLLEGVRFDGHWYWAVGGATHWQLRALYRATTALSASEGKIQNLLRLLFGEYLPAATGAGVTITDP